MYIDKVNDIANKFKAKAFVIKKVKNTELRTQVISGEEYRKDEKIVVTFYKNICKRQVKQNLTFRVLTAFLNF